MSHPTDKVSEDEASEMSPLKVKIDACKTPILKAKNETSEMSPLLVRKTHALSKTPIKMTQSAAGYDLRSIEYTVVAAHGKAKIRTGLEIQLPSGTCGRISPRSSVAWNHHISIGGGVIDEDYRGEIFIILFNHSDKDYIVNPGDRIAQLIIEVILRPELKFLEINDTERGKGGFGSTGIN